MHHARTSLVVLVLASLAHAQDQVHVSIGVRETGFAGGTFTAIGANGGSAGGIEWVNRDAQVLTLDGTWQQFTFNLTTDPIVAFAGTTANSVLEGSFGVLENIRILNSGGRTEPIKIWIDDLVNTTTPLGGQPTPTVIEDFQSYTAGTEVVFQEPSFSGSTAANLIAGSTAGVDTFVPSRSASYRCDFQFIDNVITRWLRLTTFNTTIKPNPQIRFDDSSTITFWMRGGVCQDNLGSQGPGTAIAEMCGSGLAQGESSIYYVSGAPAFTIGALFISLDGLPDLPLAGGNLVSGFGFLASLQVMSDGAGALLLPVPGSFQQVDLAVQTVFLDFTLPEAFAFTNAVRARFGF